MSAPPLPTLAQFLGDGSRSENFDEFVTHVQDLLTGYGDVDPATARLVRFMRAFSIAAVEIAQQETSAKPTAEEALDVCHAMMTGGVIAIASAYLSILSDAVPAALFREHLMSMAGPAIDEVIRVNGLK